MFLDGLVYASVSRNLALGRGSLWAPRMSETLLDPFYEHPPFFFWVQSLPFHLGQSEWVEKGFGIAALLLSIWLLFRLIDEVAPASRDSVLLVKALAVGPWLLSGLTAWIYANNALESLLTPLTLAAVLAFLRALRSPARAVAWAALGCGLALAAFLTKGLPGLFPVAVPFLYALALRRTTLRRGLAQSALAATACAACVGALVLVSGAARSFLTQYWQQQVTATLSGVRGGVPSHPPIVAIGYTLLSALWPALIPLGVLIAVRLLRRWRGHDRGDLRASALLLLVGLSASLPLVATPVIRGHYLAPSTPFYAGGLAFLTVALWPRRHQPARLSVVQWRFALAGLAVAVLVGVGVLFRHGLHPVRDEPVQEILEVCRREGLHDEVVELAPSLVMTWSVPAYLQRHLRLSVRYTDEPRGVYYLVPIEEADSLSPDYGAPADARTTRYALARRR